MSASIIDFSAAANSRRERARVNQAASADPARHPALSHDFMFWSGVSGMGYVHTVYALIDCPELPPANIILVRGGAAGRQAVHVMRVEDAAPSLNLAEVRMTAARLGADEVHVHLLASNAQHRFLIERDIALRNLDQRAAG